MSVRNPAWILLLGIIIAFPGFSEADDFYFSYTHDGFSTSLNPGSDIPGGTTLTPGDTFEIDVFTENDDYWMVGSSFSNFFFATYSLNTGGTRVSNITASIYLDGALVDQQTQLNESQASVHMGGQRFTFTAGQQFDRMNVDLEFLSSSTGTNQLNPSNDLTFSPFYEQDNISYISAIPEPTGCIATFALGSCLILRRKRRKRD